MSTTEICLMTLTVIYGIVLLYITYKESRESKRLSVQYYSELEKHLRGEPNSFESASEEYKRFLS